MSPYQGLDDKKRKMCLFENESTWITSSSSHRKSDIKSVKTSDFLDFVEGKSRSNSCKMKIHLLYFPPMIRLVMTY
jgi:hypothetical protein